MTKIDHGQLYIGSTRTYSRAVYSDAQQGYYVRWYGEWEQVTPLFNLFGLHFYTFITH